MLTKMQWPTILFQNVTVNADKNIRVPVTVVGDTTPVPSLDWRHSREALGTVTTVFKWFFHVCFCSQRREAPSSGKEGKDDNTTCIYPELVNCSLPVEQILPSLCSYTWSRGLGHVVHAQKIRTIGNLSALKEYQIKNLPIRSPKVQTLRTALTSFHLKTKGLKSKSAKDITSLSGRKRYS
jgi:hypothetical protein